MFRFYKIVIAILFLSFSTICPAQKWAIEASKTVSKSQNIIKGVKSGIKITPKIPKQQDYQQDWRKRQLFDNYQKTPVVIPVWQQDSARNKQVQQLSISKIPNTPVLSYTGTIQAQVKARVLEEYNFICSLFEINCIFEQFKLIEIGEKCMQVGLKEEAEDCFRKYIDRYCYKPSLVLRDIQKYNNSFKDLKTKSLYKYMSEITEKAILGCTYHIHCHKKELFNLENPQERQSVWGYNGLRIELAILGSLAKTYAKEELPYTDALIKIDTAAGPEKYMALEDCAKIFLLTENASPDIITCGEILTYALAEYPYAHIEYRKAVLDLFDMEQFHQYTKNNLGLSYILCTHAMEAGDERFRKYIDQCNLIDNDEFEKLLSEYYTNIYNHVMENPQEKTMIDYFLWLWGYDLEIVKGVYTDYLCSISDYITEDELYFDEEYTDYRDAMIHLAHWGDSLTKANGDNVRNLEMRYLDALIKMSYRSSAKEGREIASQLYDEVLTKKDDTDYKELLLNITTLHCNGLFYGEEKCKEAYKILKPLLEVIEENSENPGYPELLVLSSLIDYSKELGKNRTAKKAQEVMDRMFPDGMIEE